MLENTKSLTFGDVARAATPSPETLAILAERRSTPAKQMVDGGPSDEELHTLLRLASRVPDHGKLGPWRFIIFRGEARTKAGQILHRRFADKEPNADPERLALEERRFRRAGTVVAVVSTPIVPHKIPQWEQELTAGAVCQNLLIGAHAMGYASQWLTEWYAYDEPVLREFGLTADEKIAGYIYIGGAPEEVRERSRPILEEKIAHF